MGRTIALGLGGLLACLVCGCALVPIALVGGGVVGGLAISEDTVQAEYDRGYDQVWNAAADVLEKAGVVQSKAKEQGRIEGYVPKSKVTITVERLTASTVRVQVKARKSSGVLPDIKTSHKIAFRIGEMVEQPTQPTPGPNEPDE